MPKPSVAPEPPASIDYTIFKIVPDDQGEKNIHSIDDLAGKIISNIDGEGFLQANQNTSPGNYQQGLVNLPFTEPPIPEKEIIFSRSEPEFPGGRDALERFLYRNLQIPGELEAGDKKTVQVRFRINSEGLVSGIEIVKSGGERFDKEVVRVCKKMPKWKPAMQNGVSMPVTFLLPVTFIAYEQ
jgi:protein TonB